MTHLSEDDLVLHYYGEMDAAAENGATTHLRACAECHRAYTRLQRVMVLVDSAPAVDAPEGFERVAWARLEAAVPERRAGWLAWFVHSPAQLAFAALGVVLVTGAFFAGRLLPRPAAAVATGAKAADSPSAVRERILLVDLGDHLDRSQMMLIELVSGGDTSGPVDISTERTRAQQLLAGNRLYRETALKTGDTATAALLDELERVLVDVAASPSTLTQDDMDEVRRRIESKGLLFKVRVVSSDVHERQRAALKTQRIVS
jgi:hypothetical protein